MGYRSDTSVPWKRGGGRRHSYRAVVAACIVFAMLLPGIGTAGAAGARTATQPQAAKSTSSTDRCRLRNKAKGTIRFSDWIFPDTLNPFQTNTSVSATIISAMQEDIFRFDGRARLFPMLASKIPTLKNGGIKDGGKTILISLKHGLHWSNNKEVTSADVKFGWKIGMDKATGPFCSGSCDVISKIDTPNRYTAVLHLRQVFAPAIPNAMPPVFPTTWAGSWNNDAHVAAQKLGQDAQFNFESTKFPTDGPYQVKQYVRDDRIELQPMKYYSGLSCGGYIKNLVFAFYSNKAGMIAAAAGRQTDVTDDYLLVDLPELQKHTDAYKLSVLPSFAFDHFEFNVDAEYNGKPNPLANVKVRQALALSLDKLGLLRSTLGLNAKTSKNVVAWTFLVNTPTLVQPYADKAINGQWDPLAKKFVIPGSGKALLDAKKLLSQTPYKDGFSVDFVAAAGNPTRSAQITVASQNWSRLGVKVVPVLLPPSKLLGGWDQNGALDHGQFQVCVFGQVGAPDPDGSKYSMESKYVDRRAQSHVSTNQNYAGIHDSAIDRAYTAAAHTFDKKVRTKNYSTIQRLMNQNAYWIPLEYRPAVATADNHVGDFVNNPTSAGITWNIFSWKVKTG